ncbi:hypothetical protein Sps_03707 [Shewanella psychrophila]|uniref:FG-GAP repeat protein n=1 Tax=Shewanella psychrophila TaxID=225848 RepID=A0A1S6HTG6_9GAMM|nr:Ig-like domain-containing protein [Shewanella psychrophila]AQS38825.1 hypothetical protein Sps_03707 [Shewanella psychrophila]
MKNEGISKVVEPFLTAGGTVTLRHVLTNLDTVNAASDISFSLNVSSIGGISVDTLPVTGDCGVGSLFNPVVDSENPPTITDVSVSSAGLAAGDSCTFDVLLSLPTSLAAGNYNVSVGTILSTINSQLISSGSPSASESVIIDTAPSLSFSFVDTTVLPGSAGVINFSLQHDFASSDSATAIGFTLDLDAVMTGMVATGLPSGDICGSGSSISGTGMLTFTGGTLAAADTCDFSVSVQLPADTVGDVTFTSSVISAQVNGNNVSNSVNSTDLSVSGLSFTKSFNIGSVDVESIRVGASGADVDLTYLITNVAGAGDATAIQFSEDFSKLNVGASVTSVAQSNFCGASSSATGTTMLMVSGVEVSAGSQCALTVTVNFPAGTLANSYTTASSTLMATIGGVMFISPAIDSISVNEITVASSVDVTSPTSNTSVNMTINFSDDVTDFIQSDITAINGTLSGFSGSGSNYSVVVTPIADGVVTLSIAAGVAIDALDATVTNTAAVDVEFEYQTTPLVPTPSLVISAPSSSLAGTGPVTYTISYFDAEQVNLDTQAITLNSTDTAQGEIVVTNGDTTTAIVTIQNISGQGKLGITIAEGTARFSTNLAPSAGPSSTFVVDAIKPNVVLSGPNGGQTGSFAVDIVFDENVTGFTVDDISVVNASLADFQVINSASYSVQVEASGEVDVSVSVAAGAATDTAGNGNTVSNTLSYAFDDVLPTVVISGPVNETAAPFTATFTFSEDVTGFALEDIQYTNATLSEFSAQNTTSYSVLVTPIEQALVTLTLAADVANDLLGNGNVGSTYSVTYNLNYSPSINTNIYFSPAPATQSQEVNLVVGITNLGLADANDVSFEIVIADVLTIVSLPEFCQEGDTSIECVLGDKLDVNASHESIFTFSVNSIESGFADANLTLTASNISGPVNDSANLLLANILSQVPGVLLSATPTEVGVTADVDGDGFVDMLAFDASAMTITIYTNDGAGSLTLKSNLDMLQDVKAILLADVNGDDVIDIITAGGASANSMAYLLNSELGIESSIVLDAVKADFILATDFGQDDTIELVLAGISQVNIAIYSGLGTSEFNVELVNAFELASLNGSSAIQGEKNAKVSDNSQAPAAAPVLADTGITAITLIETDTDVSLVVAGNSSLPVLVSQEEGTWMSTPVISLSQAVEKFITTDIDNDGLKDAFIYSDSTWQLIKSVFELDYEVSNVKFPNALDILVADVNDDGVSEIFFVTPQGVSIWHYYGLNDIRVDEAVIVSNSLKGIALLDLDNDGDLDIVTFDSQNGVSLWYLSLDGGFGLQETDVSIFADGPNFPQVDVASPVMFSIGNLSGAIATEVSVSISVGTRFELSNIPGNCVGQDGEYVCNLGEIAGGTRKKIELWITPKSVGEFSIIATVERLESDTNEHNDTVKLTLDVQGKNDSESSSGSMQAWAIFCLLTMLAYRRVYPCRRAL